MATFVVCERQKRTTEIKREMDREREGEKERKIPKSHTRITPLDNE